MTPGVKKLLAYLAGRERGDEAHRSVSKARHRIRSRLPARIVGGAQGLVERLLGRRHKPLKKRLGSTGESGGSDENLVLDRFQHHDAGAEVSDIVVAVSLGRHGEPFPVDWPGWANIDPATLSFAPRYAARSEAAE